jgi:hypothetical protein
MTLRRETAVAAGFDSLRRFEDCVAYENNACCDEGTLFLLEPANESNR